MSGFTLFTSSLDGISFFPEYGFKKQDKKIENRIRTRAGREHVYQFSNYRRWSIPLRYVSSSDTETINEWWRNNTELLFYDNNDTSAAGTFSVRIVNKVTPIGTVERPYDYEWRGKIELEEF